ncbi:ATP-binding SpoIIE family protein phosphatase [Microbispora sp. H10949]|uniref:ATP-binding SpoIIE family protein phosphatase n=1 Tax=Microbispora sp. H10949 TaxID=2729111 RepID=UPI001C71F848|nr:SpoIIE family protein phosphatase [Microbispora sp. H10949]
MATAKVRSESHAEQPQAEQLGVVWASDEGHWSAQTLTLALQQAVTSLGGLGALVHRCDSATGRLHLAAASGLLPETAEVWADLCTAQDVAPTRALGRGGFVWVCGDSLGIGAAGTAALPLPGADGPVGVLSVLTAGPAEPDDEQRSFLGAVAAWAAARLEGLPGTAPGLTSAAGSEKTVQMGELTAALAEAVTSRDVVQAVADHVLPPFCADGLVVWLIEGDRVDVVGAAGYPPEFLSLLDRVPLTETASVMDVLTSGTPRFIGSRAEYRRRYPTMKIVAEASPKNAWALLPVIASGRAIGVCVVSFARERVFSDEERTLLTALSGLVGQALERARLYDVEHARAQELQRGLLPRELPRLPVACAAARYLPAGRGEEVGGDWYDLIPLSGSRVAIVIGDVMGHGITEAVTMGRLRTAVSTLADLDLPPDELIGHLNDLVSDLGDDFYATCLYAVFDPTTRTCTLCLAGHPPPVIVYPDGTVVCPYLAADPPLGAAEPPFEVHELHLAEESLLVLCTDGLVESATRDVDQGLAQLCRILAQAVPRIPHLWSGDQCDDVGCLENLCDTVVSALLPAREETDDDAALFIAHTRGTAADDVATCSLPDDPRAAGQARRYVRKQLATWGLDELTVTTELLVSELVGNVIRHAKGPVCLRLLRSRSLICEVYDGSLSTPRIRHSSYTDEGGRGLQLVAALSRRWGARYLYDGKCIWTEQSLPTDDHAKQPFG